jgi:hypothetical protein
MSISAMSFKNHDFKRILIQVFCYQIEKYNLLKKISISIVFNKIVDVFTLKLK